jgi:hypothetical protein
MAEQSYRPGDVVNGHVLTSDGRWVAIAPPTGTATAPSAQPGFETPPGQSANPPGPTYTPVAPTPTGPPHGATPPSAPFPPPVNGEGMGKGKGRKVLAGVGVCLVAIVTAAIATSGGGDADEAAPRSTPTVQASNDASDGVSAAVEPPATPEVDLASFAAVDAARWDEIARDPDAAIGEQVVVFAEVTQLDTATGTEVFRANVGAMQPAAEFELAVNTVVRGDQHLIAAVAQGDVLKVYAVIAGSVEYDTMIGGATVAPLLEAIAVEDVGYLDITVDAVLGPPVLQEYGGLDVPVTVTNSATSTMTYMVDVVAESPDGSVQHGTATAYVENLAPGQTANVEASFYEDVPTDAVYRVATVERHDY